MRLTIKRIAGVYKASIVLDGITVLAGKNDTGKSTVGKSLWCMVQSLHNASAQVEHERAVRYRHILDVGLPVGPGAMGRTREEAIALDETVHKLVRMSEAGPLDRADVEREVLSALSTAQELLLAEDEPYAGPSYLDDLVEYSSIPSKGIRRALLERRLENEFYGQISSIEHVGDGSVTLIQGSRKYTATITDDKVVELTGDGELRAAAIYLDDPSILAHQYPGGAYRHIAMSHEGSHQSDLRALIRSGRRSRDVLNEIVVDNKLKGIMDTLSSVVSGTIVLRGSRSVVYRRAGGNADLDVRNLSSGMKSFAILKTLLQKELIHEGDVLILDEPEMHLHPQWQLIYAELVVLLYKAFNVKVLLATHSPYFLRALEVFSAHHEVADRCRYYHAMRDEDGAFFEDVTFDTEAIYEDMSVPFSVLDELMPEE